MSKKIDLEGIKIPFDRLFTEYLLLAQPPQQKRSRIEKAADWIQSRAYSLAYDIGYWLLLIPFNIAAGLWAGVRQAWNEAWNS